MIIGFIGDVHGMVLHAIALTATWQAETDRQFDLIIQVGDMGAFPDMDRADSATDRYLAAESAQADFSGLLRAGSTRAENLRRVRQQLSSPIHFVRGNHEDFDYLNGLQIDEASRTAKVDLFDVLRFVPDGKVLSFGNTRVAFLVGGEEQSDARAINEEACQSLLDLGPGVIDVLVTHQGPYGSCIGYRGDVHGSHTMTHLIENIEPTFHVAGHTHQMSGPTSFGRTAYLGLDGLVASAIWHPEENGFSRHFPYQAAWTQAMHHARREPS